MKLYLIALTLIILSAFAIFSFGKNQCQKENLIKEQEQEIRTQETIIIETKKINERRNKALIASHDDNLVWLAQNICQDC